LSPFEYLFAFYSLLLGLAAANVAGGFADMWRERRTVAVGFSAPLVAAMVLVGVMNAWITFWREREAVSFGPWWMLAAAGIALPYVFASRAMFPAPGQASSLEEHYFAHRRIILATLLLPPLVSRIANLALARQLPAGWEAAYFATRMLLPLALILIAQRTAHRIGLALLLAVMVAGLFR
jgi:hypothetical protein